ncbi:Uncharacterised protein [Salmonella enterica subsp. arizonae]|nr:Uncharacterised protein [Salmonella enterica subsp. arizonae]
MVVMPKPIRPSGAGLANLVLPKFEKVMLSECLLFSVLAMKKLYSYIRWSTDKQTGNTSLERQTEKAKQYAAIHGLEYVQILVRASLRFAARIPHEVNFMDSLTLSKLGLFHLIRGCMLRTSTT